MNEIREIRGITCCGDCGYYNWKKHNCSRGCKDEGLATDSFYKDCPLPKVQLVNQWIPCSERLPERDADYLVTINSDYFYGEGSIVLMAYSENKWWYYNDEQGYVDWFTDEVLAWMPLPEPYKAGDPE